MITEASIKNVYERLDIVDIISDFVSLKKRGQNHIGLCPFHNERTPSFSVSQAKGIYKCFGCGAGGNAVNFVIEHEKISYLEAIKYIAKKYNIPIEEKEQTEEDKKKRNDRESLQIVMDIAEKHFADNLWNTDLGKSVGLEYFRMRELSQKTIKQFGLGFAMKERDNFYKFATKNGYKDEYLKKAGLINDNKQDVFSDRIIFPIYSLMGKVIAFGGRTLSKKENTPKYLNSPETEIYTKGDNLYALNIAKKEIVKQDKCFVVEGYFDVIRMHERGFANTVASLGTSLTEAQIRLIRRFTKNITLLYDGDSAGITAAARVSEICLKEGMNTKIIILPKDQDPDNFAINKTEEEIIKYFIDNEKDFILFKTNNLFDQKETDPIKKAENIRKILQTIAIIPDSTIRISYIKECQKIIKDISEEQLIFEINKIIREQKQKNYTKQEKQIQSDLEQNKAKQHSGQINLIDQDDIIEREILLLLLNYGNINVKITHDENGKEEQKEMKVAEYVIKEVERDEIQFKKEINCLLFEEYKTLFGMANSVDEKQFILHPNQNISVLSANLLFHKYKESRIWEKKNLVETIEEMLNYSVPKAIYEFKYHKIMQMLKNIEAKFKDYETEQNEEKLTEMQEKMILINKYKQHYSKILGDRIILAN